jgi:hypothetical protein
VGVVLGALLIGLELRQGAQVARAAEAMVLLIAFLGAIWVFQTRSEMASALAGKPVDERWQHMNEQATMAAMGMGLIAAVLGFAICEAQGCDNWQFALMAIVLSFGYMAALAWYRWRL